MRLSILDQTPVFTGENATLGFQHTITLARKAEELGYYRFWVTEHHDTFQLAGSSPEVLISHILAKTDKIRIGSGGVMLQHYSPYKVAENFNVLSCLAPGRVDLGIGRSPGGQQPSISALQRDFRDNTTSFSKKLLELKGFLGGDNGSSCELRAIPEPVCPPKIFLLGASSFSAQLAAELGLSYVYAQFINGDENVRDQALSTYRKNIDSCSLPESEIILAVHVIVADTDAEAKELAGNFKCVEVLFESGKTITVETIEQANEIGSQSQEEYTVTLKEPNIIYGSKQTVRDKILDIRKKTQIDELIISSIIPDFEKRVYSFELLSDVLL